VTGILLLLAAALVAAPRPAIATARLRVLIPAASRTASWRIGPPTGRTGVIAVASAGSAAGFALIAMSGPGGVLLPGIAGAVAGATVGRVVTTALARRSRDRVAAAQVDSVAALAAEIRAGQRPEAALDATGAGAVPEVLDALWALSERSGAPVATVLDRLEDDLRARTRRRQAVATELAGARSTAALLAGLPALGVALGAAMGSTPLAVLFGTTTGQLALVAGVALDSAGVLWTARIVSAADGER
jgi:tight adherence protein B